MSVDVIKNMGHSVNVRLKHIATVCKVSFDYLLLRAELTIDRQGKIYKAFYYLDVMLKNAPTPQASANTYWLMVRYAASHIPFGQVLVA